MEQLILGVLPAYLSAANDWKALALVVLNVQGVELL